MTNIVLPYNFVPRWYQKPIFEAFDRGMKRFVIVHHRRAGKDKAIFNCLIREVFKRVGTYYYVFPTYAQGKKVIWEGADNTGFKFLDHIPADLIKSKNNNEMKIEFVNGSILRIVGSDDVDSLVGTNPIGIVFSEFGLQKRKAWDLLRPILLLNGGWAAFVSTPRGKNHLYEQLMEAQRFGEEKGYFWQVLTVDDTMIVPKEALELERLTMPSDLFMQEYYVKFNEGGSTFIRGIRNAISENVINSNTKPYVEYQLGVDLAKARDFSVLTAIDLHTFQVEPQVSFNQVDFVTQKNIIKSYWYEHNCGLINMDGTGLGAPIVDDLQNDGLDIDPFIFSGRSREELLNNLRIKIEQKIIKLPNDPELIEQLEALQYVMKEDDVTGKTKVKIEVPDNMHDDRVMSLALAVWNLPKDKVPLGKYSQGYQPSHDFKSLA